MVFEILSPSNTLTELNKKQVFYHRYGVEEYYLYNPDTNDLSGWLRSGDEMDVIDPIANWVSPRLGIRFDLSSPVLQIYRPDGKPFLSYVAIAEQAESRARQAEQRADQERQKAEQLAKQLRAMGIDPDQV